MLSYAQTILQLLQQLERLGYSQADKIYIHNAYQFLIKRVVCHYRPSGKTMIAHAIGTASILASLKTTKEVITAGMLHVIYPYGDFGDGTAGISVNKQQQTIAVIGKQAEEYVRQYTQFIWTWENLPQLQKCIPIMTPMERNVLLIRLANELEDNLDLGILYCSNAEVRQKENKLVGHLMVELASALGFPTLADELSTAFQASLETRIFREFCHPGFAPRDFAIAPQSYLLKPTIKFHRTLVGVRQITIHSISKVKQKLRSWISRAKQKVKRAVRSLIPAQVLSEKQHSPNPTEKTKLEPRENSPQPILSFDGQHLQQQTSSKRKTILLTGAAGEIGRSLRQLLGEQYHFRCLDRTRIQDAEDIVVADIRNFRSVLKAMQGVEAVIHLAANREVSQPWNDVYKSGIQGTYNVFEAARQAGVRQIIYASTIRVSGWREIMQEPTITPEQGVRPDSLYAVGKVFGEALGQFFADQYGISVVCLRIGAFWTKPTVYDLNDHLLAAWCSPRDLAQLVERSLERENLGFQIFYGISGNTRRYWEISNAQEILGYKPQDNAEDLIM